MNGTLRHLRRWLVLLVVPLVAATVSACSGGNSPNPNPAPTGPAICQDTTAQANLRQAVLDSVESGAKSTDKTTLTAVADHLDKVAPTTTAALGAQLTNTAKVLVKLANGLVPSAAQVTDMAKAFQGLGHEIDAICPPVSFTGDKSGTATGITMAPAAYEVLSLAVPDKNLCNMNDSRGKIPSDFVIKACFDSTYLYLVNDLSVPLVVDVKGGSSSIGNQTQSSVASRVTAEIFGDKLNLMMPGFKLKYTMNNGAGEVKVSGPSNKIQKTYKLVRFVDTFLPLGKLGEAGKALVDFVVDIIDVVEEGYSCLDHSTNFWSAMACEATLMADTAKAAAKAGLSIAKKVVQAVFKMVISFKDVLDDINSSGEYNHGSKSFSIAAKPKRVEPVDPGPGPGPDPGTDPGPDPDPDPDPDTGPPPPPPPTPSVSVAKGAPVSISGCSSGCNFIVVTLNNFAPNTTYGFTCYADWPPPVGPYASNTVTTNGSGYAQSSRWCVFGYSGHTVWAMVNGYESGHLVW